MMAWFRPLAVVVCLEAVAPPLASAAVPGAYPDCQRRAAGVEAQLKLCAAAELTRRDDELNGVYRSLLAKVDPSRQPLLRASERAWVAFRDAECTFRASAEAGGSNAPCWRRPVG